MSDIFPHCSCSALVVCTCSLWNYCVGFRMRIFATHSRGPCGGHGVEVGKHCVKCAVNTASAYGLKQHVCGLDFLYNRTFVFIVLLSWFESYVYAATNKLKQPVPSMKTTTLTQQCYVEYSWDICVPRSQCKFDPNTSTNISLLPSGHSTDTCADVKISPPCSRKHVWLDNV